jgi:spore coat polysaccharide biosynthesis predicted glycosyltransferase SpsG
MSSRIVLRAASGTEVGLGHVRRTRAVAQALADLADSAEEPAGAGEDGVPRLVVDDEVTAEQLRDEGFDAVSAWAEPGWARGPIVAAWLDGFRDWSPALIDLAGARTLLVENRTGRGLATAVVQASLHWRADAWETAQPKRVLGGAGWIPLAREITALTPRPRAERDVDLLVTFGGSDPEHLTERVVEALAGSDDRLIVTIGAYMEERRERIEELCGELPNAQVLHGSDDLGPVMRRSRAAVTALGTTLYELAYLRVPAWIVANYEEDRAALEHYERNGPHTPLGVAGDLSERALGALLEGPPQVKAWPEGLGGGARRIAEWLRRGPDQSASG